MKIIKNNKIKFAVGFTIQINKKTYTWLPFVILDNWKETLYCLFFPAKIKK